ncbi:MAG: YidC/Oxa1 family insertase periplasmic-domain containing protein [Kiritimatiellae bacterium]|nr:YidC/Oxa1 family insertase periplasmic-domain containing protein [Kiritimatiellia bacterium]
MNKTEKFICLVLGGILLWYLFMEMPKQQKAQREAAVAAQKASAAQSPAAVQAPQPATAVAQPVASAEAPAAPALPSVPEETVVLENDDLRLELSTWGGVVKKATLKRYAKGRGPVGDGNPPVEFDFATAPLGALGGDVVAYSVAANDGGSVVFSDGVRTRRVSLLKDYIVTFEDSAVSGATTLSLGSMSMGGSKNDILSVDSWALNAGKGKPGVIHHCEGDSPLKGYLVGGISGGCGGSKSAAGLPASASVPYPGAQTWIALKNRFFVTALVSTTAENSGFTATVARDTGAPNYRPKSVSAVANLKADGAVTSVFFVGPKRQSLLWDLGMKDVMEFGMWRWICYPVVWTLNLFNGWIPNYGVAIILLTILVRLLFWPLTHKSTVGMKKMQEIQPLMKEIQARYKDNPQRMQQETWALYKEHKVNPMSSCLPMLIQIPVFIALFNVLRSAVELRYAPFLWIGDLSEPEGLFASWFPFGGLNILPILMAATMALQSALTPSAGDKSQQKMMMVFMPIMMLFMFYSFPSALSLYWTLSQVMSIVQMWMIRRSTQKAQSGAAVVPDAVIDPPQTRQMRRHN